MPSSVYVILNVSVPISLTTGVPLKVLSAVVYTNQVGRAAPLLCVGTYVTVYPVESQKVGMV